MKIIDHLLPVICLLMTFCTAYSQNDIDKKGAVKISGAAGITSNGISLVPNFSLEQPAAIFNLNLFKGRFSFEPELTFSLQELRPWYQIYWLRYRIIDKGRFRLRIGAHPGFNFINEADLEGNESIQVERYLTGELVPSYQLTNNISLGIYYLVAQGYDINTNELLHFITLNASFKKLRISKTLFLEFTPEIYYLTSFADGEGYYLTSLLKLMKSNFPLSLSTRMNKAISTEIEGKDFLWNLTVTYSFRKATISFN